MARQKLVVVLGMHRSGTSALTRGLQVFSVSLGDRLMPPLPFSNAKGFWEDLDICAFNDELLASIGRSWQNISPVTPDQVDVWRRDGLAARAADLLRTKMAGHDCYGIKDPRLPLLLPFWAGVFRDLDLDVRYLLAARHPASVALSLARRDGLGLDHGHLLWLGHILGALAATAGAPRLLVDYDRLLLSPGAELQRIGAFLGREADTAELRIYTEEFLDSTLRHHHQTDGSMGPAGLPLGLIEEVFSALAAQTAGPYSLDGEAFLARSAIWLAEFAEIGKMLATVDNLAFRLQRARAENRLTALDLQAKLAAARQTALDLQAQLAAARQASLDLQNRLTASEAEWTKSEAARAALEDRVVILLRLRPFWRRAGSFLLRHLGRA